MDTLTWRMASWPTTRAREPRDLSGATNGSEDGILGLLLACEADFVLEGFDVLIRSKGLGRLCLAARVRVQSVKLNADLLREAVKPLSVFVDGRPADEFRHCKPDNGS